MKRMFIVKSTQAVYVTDMEIDDPEIVSREMIENSEYSLNFKIVDNLNIRYKKGKKSMFIEDILKEYSVLKENCFNVN